MLRLNGNGHIFLNCYNNLFQFLHVSRIYYYFIILKGIALEVLNTIEIIRNQEKKGIFLF